nr:hypothetical protein [Helcococcus sueciensis]
MKKKSILIIIVILFISLLLYIAGNIKYSDKNNFQDRWEIELPKKWTVEEIYSDLGFTADGYRIIKLDTKGENLEKTINKNIKKRKTFPDFINELIEKSKLNIDKDNLEYIGIIENLDGDTLGITYNDIDKCYYLFEDIK